MNYPVIDIYDTTLSVWEDAVDEASFRSRIFDPLIRFLRGRGWKVGQDPEIVKHYRCLRKWRRRALKGELLANLELTGRVVRMEIWQELHSITHHAGGRFEYGQRLLMPPMLRRRCDLEVLRIVEFLSGVTATASRIVAIFARAPTSASSVRFDRRDTSVRSLAAPSSVWT